VIPFSFALAFLAPALLSGFQTPTEPGPSKDFIPFKNGEKLIGTLLRSTGDNVLFKSDNAGGVEFTWDQIQELHVAQEVAVVPKGVRLKTHESDAKIPEGRVSMIDESLTILPRTGAPITLPLSQTADLINMQTFSHAVLNRPAWYENWKGSASVALALVEATQRSQTYSSCQYGARYSREDWMDPESRTTLAFSSSFGELIQPNTPTVKTSIFHALGERDRYLSPMVFVFGNAGFDHDYSQGLDWQQVYSGGIGWSVINRKDEQLDVRSSMGYERQAFFDATRNQYLFSSVVSESYDRNYKHATLHQDLSITPSWSNLDAYSGAGNMSITVPVYERTSLLIGATDTYLK
jgi:hypothetical protein